MPERMNIGIKTISLQKENDYIISLTELDCFVQEVNKELKEKYHDLDYQPKVRAFLNINLHNPLGTVLGPKQKKILGKIGEVANKIFHY